MQHNGSVIDRREFLAVGAAVPSALRVAASGRDLRARLRLQFAVSKPPAIPPTLRLDAPHRAVVEFEESARGSCCSMSLRVVLDGEACLLPLATWTGDDAAYWHAREALRLPAFRGNVARAGGRWSLSIAGREAFAARAGAAGAETVPAEGPLPWVTYRHALDPDWRRGPLGGGNAELWLLRDSPEPDFATLRPEDCDTSGDVDGWLGRLGAEGPVAASFAGGSAGRAAEFRREVDSSALEPFSLRRYTALAPGLPAAARLHLSAAEIDDYRRRREFRLSNVLLVSVDASADRSAVQSVLPPPCVAPQSPAVRVMTVRGLDSSTLDEAWLFASCSLDGRRFWYAVSHLRGALAGTEFGREVLGYPTGRGEVTGVLGASRFATSVQSGGRSLFHAEGLYGGFSTGTSLAEMPVATLRLQPGPGRGAPRGEIVTQPWYFQGLRKPVRRESLFASFPSTGNSERQDAWSRTGAARAHWASVFDNATLQRLPGTVAAEVGDVAPYYRDRCGDSLPWEEPRPAGRRAGPS